MVTGTVQPVSKTGQASSDLLPAPAQAPAGAGSRARANRARSGRAIVRLVLRPVLAVLVLGVLAALGLALRLAAGPLEVTWLVHAVTPISLGGGSNADGRGRAGPPSARLEVGRAWLRWDGFRSGVDAPLAVRLEDVTIRRPGGAIVDHLDTVRVSLVATDLVVGTLSIEEIGLSGARLNLRRDSEHGLDLGLLPGGETGHGGSSGPMLHWNALRRVRVADLQLSVHDVVVGQDWSVRDVAIDVSPAGTGIVGRFGATLLAAGHRTTLHGEGAAVPPGIAGGSDAEDGDVAWHVALDPVVPSELAGILPMLAPLRALALPVASTLDIGFANGPGQFMQPVRASLSLSLGRGQIDANGTALRVASGIVQVQASLPTGLDDAVALRLRQADLQLRAASDAYGAEATGPLLHASGTLSVDSLSEARYIRTALQVDSPRIDFATLAQYWPEGMAAGARNWITANITGGTARDLHVETRLDSDTGWSHLAEIERTGGFEGDGLTLWWLRPIAPLHDMRARLSFEGPDTVLIEAPHAVMPVEVGTGPAHTIDVSNGSMRITGLTATKQIATVRIRLDGDLGDLLAELAHPRLKLLSVHPVPFKDASGRSLTDVEVVLPLDSDVSIDAITVKARSQMTAVHLGNVVAGRSLDQARLTVSADTEGLAVEGDGLVSGIAAQLRYAMDFRSGPPDQVTEQAHVRGVVSTDALRHEGLDPSDNVEGSGRLAVEYAAHRSGAAQVSLGLDLADLAVSTPVWSKARGLPAHAEATIGLQHGHLVSVDRIEADGPGLAVQAHAAISNGRAHQVVVGHFTVGRTNGAGRIDLPADVGHGAPPGPIRVSAHGSVLDLSAAIDGGTPSHPPKPKPASRRPAGAASPSPSWVADLAFDTVFVGKRTALGGVAAHVENDGQRIATARIDASAPTPISVRLAPEPGGRHLSASAADLGRLLSVLGVTDALAGGALRLDGRFDDRTTEAPLDGTVEVGRFLVRDAPLAARIVRNLSIYGWLAAPRSPQLRVGRLVAPFSLAKETLTLTDARAHSAALGVTLRGAIDLGHQSLDLKGTVVPVWAINQLPGRLPGVGRLFSPEKGGGVLAATVRIRGPFSSPDVHVNALSALAPGFLRRLLFE